MKTQTQDQDQDLQKMIDEINQMKITCQIYGQDIKKSILVTELAALRESLSFVRQMKSRYNDFDQADLFMAILEAESAIGNLIDKRNI